MSPPWSSLPQGAVLVCATVITTGVPAVASAGQREQEQALDLASPEEVEPAHYPVEEAPTCGPCCHGGGPECGEPYYEDDLGPPPPDETPPPLEEPGTKKGCAVEDEPADPLALGLLGLGVLGAGLRRRRPHEP